ncbi:type II toxin-antitoxin system CcdA family antitoxin [Magnetospirillum sulfuroxidans]|uniref:Type II toxin-antitoxin system CcdA family antitoxin n=1 Tax=Magnetospirillum sulfuroxidans TaxID=611300 RepID=A0ABS5IE16_9PROT|nr:type II toxin-antitoxin system CcdA family antitoxin [Magnetospirillum sulfuroxidans]MBR9972655.1 type II toxin-antitoxin system CcdA family antitoxin [Magnetospirillum sulfuroxidans]
MSTVSKKSNSKQSCNLSINAALLREAKGLGINLSQTLESELEKLVRQAKAKTWAEENREAIESQNRWIEKHGLWSDGLRMF